MLSQITKSMGWPFILVYIALIVSALYFTFVTAPKALNANDWPYVQGKVIKSELIERKRTTKQHEMITVYSAKIYFEYTVKGKTYAAWQIKWADRNKDNIQALIDNKQPIGSNVTVYYNPRQPSESVLQQGLNLGHTLTGLFLLVSISAMAWSLYSNARKRRLK